MNHSLRHYSKFGHLAQCQLSRDHLVFVHRGPTWLRDWLQQVDNAACKHLSASDSFSDVPSDTRTFVSSSRNDCHFAPCNSYRTHKYRPLAAHCCCCCCYQSVAVRLPPPPRPAALRVRSLGPSLSFAHIGICIHSYRPHQSLSRPPLSLHPCFYPLLASTVSPNCSIAVSHVYVSTYALTHLFIRIAPFCLHSPPTTPFLSLLPACVHRSTHHVFSFFVVRCSFVDLLTTTSPHHLPDTIWFSDHWLDQLQAASEAEKCISTVITLLSAGLTSISSTFRRAKKLWTGAGWRTASRRW